MVANPAVDADQVVGVATWLWVRDVRPLSVTASIPGTTAELVATPVAVRFDMGDGEAPLVMGTGPGFACQLPGVAYDPALLSAAQHSDCTHTYPRSSAGQPGDEHTVVATMSWDLDWAADTGASGSLRTLERSTSFTLRVAEARPWSRAEPASAVRGRGDQERPRGWLRWRYVMPPTAHTCGPRYPSSVREITAVSCQPRQVRSGPRRDQ